MKKHKIAHGDGKAIAIVGMSGFFPQADDLDAFALNLSNGRDSVRAITDTRIRYSCLDPKLDYLEAGLLDRVDQFDYRFFRISRFEAEMMDPQQRLILQLTCSAIEHAGYRLSDFNGSNTGVFLAAPPTSTYKPFLRQEDPAAQMGNLYAVMAGRIAYLLNLTGPALMIDTACSSSLVAVIEACKNLQLGLIDYAITGGIRIGSNFEVQSEGNPSMDVLETEDDRCKAFDASANGIVPGEGGGIIVLKMLDKALRDNNTIHAVIRGYASNQDGGRTVGITAPSPQAQKELLLSAWKSAGIDPSTISYIEAHGTGTKLGDPIEIKGMTDAFSDSTPEKGFCAVSSVKTNIGHLGTAAGIAGLLKVVLSMKAGKLYPSLHFNRPNPHINFGDSAVYVNTQYTDWSPVCGIRRAGVSSFGISGTNSHVILEEVLPMPVVKAKKAPELLTLSAKTYPALKEYLRRVTAFAGKTSESLRNVAFTLNAGRDDYKLRKAFVISTKEALVTEIDKMLANWDAVEHKLPEADNRSLILLLSGNAKVDPEAMQQLARQYAPFRQALANCEQADGADLSESGQLFVWYYALVSLLKELGVSVKNLIGSGIGNLVIGVLSRKLSLAEGLQAATDYVPTGKALEQQKLYDYVRSLGEPMLLELGSGGELGGLVSQLAGERYVQLSGGSQTAFLSLMAALYEYNVPIDWTMFYQKISHRRVTVPTYPFEKTRAWYREPLTLSTHDVSQWLYDVDWVPTQFETISTPSVSKHWLVFMPQLDFGRVLGQRLEGLGQQVTRIYFGTGYEVAGPRTFFVRPDVEDDYRQLLEDLSGDTTPFDGILHLGNYGTNQGPLPDNTGALLSQGLYSQFLVAKVFSDVLLQRKTRFIMVSSNAVPVLADESPIVAERSASMGFLRGLVAEYENVKAKCIDLPGSSAASEVDTLLSEIGREDKYIVAYRNNQRYVQRLKAHAASQLPAFDLPLPIKSGGVYIVTGGTDGIGLEICRSFIKEQPIRLIVIGRTVLPDRPDWSQYVQTPDDGSSRYRKTRNLQSLTGSESEILYYPCNMADDAEVTALLGDIYRQHGRIAGIVHSAALPGQKWIKQNTLKEFEEVTACRIQGVVALVKGTQANPPDFTMIFSSVSGLLPAYPRKADYAASCVFADTYVRQAARERNDLRLIHWCDWQETGMSYRVVDNPEEFSERRQFLHLANTDGIEAFRLCLLGSTTNSVILANYGLSTAEQRQYLVDNPYFTSGEEMPQTAPPESVTVAAKTSEVQMVATPEPKPAAQAGSKCSVSDIEQFLTSSWQEVLKVEDPAPGDDFFDLGGHSLNGFKVIRQVEKQYNVALEMDDLFDFPVLRDLAARIFSLMEPVQLIQERPLEPLSSAQQRLWALHMYGQGTTAYNIYKGYTIEGVLDREAFTQSFNTLIERHEILRTVFVTETNEPRQKILDASDLGFVIRYRDRQGIPGTDGYIAQLEKEEMAQAFDLEKGPLLRATLVQLADQRYVFLFTVHHIIADGLSILILVNELLALYNAYRSGQPNPLHPVTAQYKDFARWQREQQVTGAQRSLQQFWINELKGNLPELNLVTDFPRTVVQEFEGDMIRFTLDSTLADSLRAVTAAAESTLFIHSLAVFSVLLAKYAQQEEMVIGFPVDGRNHADFQETVGMFVNVLPVRSSPYEGKTFQQLVQETKSRVLAALRNRDCQFEDLVQGLELPVKPGRNPLFEVLFQMDAIDTSGIEEQDDVQFKPLDFESNAGRFDLHLSLKDDRHGMFTGALFYRTTLFRRETIGQMVKNYLFLLDQVVKDPNVLIRDLQITHRFNEPSLPTAEEANDFVFS